MKSILIAGVGGQGTLLASMVLGNIAIKLGYDVKLSEVHGMAQRGGSVVTYVRMGDAGERVYSPMIDEGGADTLLAFEQLEALRWLPYVKPGGKVYVNTQKTLPMPVITGAMEYPADIPEKIAKDHADAVFIDALALAKEAGSVKAVNTVLLGRMARDMDIETRVWLDVIAGVVKPRFVEINNKAFMLGYGEGNE
ncbi:MAG TPA: indolepyruvate oxidoreductase subunit beta [Clostridiales bacterium]|nr:indolepyruvate oxidoreductase subunit beta [Clostridiales bacterium]